MGVRSRWVWIVVVVFSGTTLARAMGDDTLVPYTERWEVKLRSLDPMEILSKLELSGPGLEKAKRAAEAGDREAALGALLEFYRKKYPLPALDLEGSKEATKGRFVVADGVVDHVLQWGPYEAADYGEEMDWSWDPRGDIEWVAAVYRFHWAAPLAEAFEGRRDEKYGKAFVELTTDWIAKHPLEERDQRHPVYTHWRGYPWLDIQTGIRATRICSAFKTLVHADAFTPEFLGVVLASLYDHQVKTERVPMGMIHNKAIFEQRGFVNVAATFREFKDSKRWVAVAVDQARQSLLAQTTFDGVQREWSSGYHLGVLRDAEEMAEHAASFGVAVPADYRERMVKMYDYLFAMATPDLGMPMFGDGGRSPVDSKDRSRWPLYGKLVHATERLGDPKYAARAKLERGALGEMRSFGFSEAGMYAMRSDWGPEEVYLALHCSPPAISGHDQPDNGTFELYAYGRWLMTDSGYYTYGHDAAGRKWHRQTRVHHTLTLDGKNTQVDGRELLWETEPGFDALVVENASYPTLRHRRSVWFVDRRFFVLLDEAIGDATGELGLHFQMAVGDVVIDEERRWVRTDFDDANVLVWADPKRVGSVEKESGWFAWSYGKRAARTAVTLRHERTAPAAYLTILVPYRGKDVPAVSADIVAGFEVGANAVSVRVTEAGNTWEIERDLKRGKAWCRRK